MSVNALHGIEATGCVGIPLFLCIYVSTSFCWFGAQLFYFQCLILTGFFFSFKKKLDRVVLRDCCMFNHWYHIFALVLLTPT